MKCSPLSPFGAGPAHWFGALPPNQGMKLTGKIDTPFAERRAKGAPILPAAYPWR